MVLYQNDTTTDFITSDSPIVNITGGEKNGINAFYYPISPKIAIKLCIQSDQCVGKKENEKCTILPGNEKVVIRMNEKVFENAVNEVYARNKTELVEFENGVSKA